MGSFKGLAKILKKMQFRPVPGNKHPAGLHGEYDKKTVLAMANECPVRGPAPEREVSWVHQPICVFEDSDDLSFL